MAAIIRLDLVNAVCQFLYLMIKGNIKYLKTGYV